MRSQFFASLFLVTNAGIFSTNLKFLFSESVAPLDIPTGPRKLFCMPVADVDSVALHLQHRARVDHPKKFFRV